VLPDTAKRFARAIVMPNLKPPVTTVALALAYRQRILDALPAASSFDPLMTLYLTDNTRPEEIIQLNQILTVKAVKYYPAGATTNSDAGVTDLARCAAVLEAMQATGTPLLVHGEVTDSAVDIFDRERVFLERVLTPLAVKYPSLKVVVEHITTREAAAFVKAAAAQSQCAVRRRHAPASLLFAGAQTRDASRSAGRSRDQR